MLSCTPAEAAKAGGTCPVASGEQTVRALGLDTISISGCALVLLGYIAFCRVVGYLGVRLIKW